jgi:hypothetical protein
MKKILPPAPFKLFKKKIKAPWVHASAFTCIFGCQNCQSPFLAFANGNGRDWTRKKKEQLPLAPPPKKTKAHCERMLSLPIGCIKILIPKLLVTIFGLG